MNDDQCGIMRLSLPVMIRDKRTEICNSNLWRVSGVVLNVLNQYTILPLGFFGICIEVRSINNPFLGERRNKNLNFKGEV